MAGFVSGSLVSPFLSELFHIPLIFLTTILYLVFNVRMNLGNYIGSSLNFDR